MSTPSPCPTLPLPLAGSTHRGGLDPPSRLCAGPAGAVDEQVAAFGLQARVHSTPLPAPDDACWGMTGSDRGQESGMWGGDTAWPQDQPDPLKLPTAQESQPGTYVPSQAPLSALLAYP